MWINIKSGNPKKEGYYPVYGPIARGFAQHKSNQQFIAYYTNRGWIKPITDDKDFQVYDLIVLAWFDVPPFPWSNAASKSFEMKPSDFNLT